MKKLLILFLVSLTIQGFGQTQINGATQIKDGTITEPKLAPNALRPVSSGVLSTGVLTFDEPREIFTKTVSTDLALSIAGSGNVAYSQIILKFTGDGTHVVTWPTSWDITGTYNPSAAQTLTLDYDGTTVVGKFSGAVDIVEVTLSAGVVQAVNPDLLQLSFSAEVIITSAGWTLEADGVAVDLVGVSGSGTVTPAFNLTRDIVGDEVLTLSYDPATGATTSLTGNEIEAITDAEIEGFLGTPEVDEFDLYVDDDAADDIAAGTIGDPYKTIQAASNAAVAGQVIGIRAGTYRQTIVAKTGVTYQAYTGESAWISGFEVIPNTGWTVYSGNIYQKTITLPVNGYNTSTSLIPEANLNTTIFANQLIRNDVMQIEARWPNITIAGTYGTNDYLMRSKYREAVNYLNGFNPTQLTDAGIPFNTSTSNLVGATLVANGWISQEPRTITAHPSNTVVQYATIWGTCPTGLPQDCTNNWHRKRYYLTNKLFMLDMAGEFHYQSGTLYYWQPGGGTISGVVQYKARNWGFDVRDRQNVTIKDLKFIGCDAAHGNLATSGVIIDGITAVLSNHHVRHDVVQWQGVGMSRQFGIMLKGTNNTIKNSNIGYGGSQAVWIGAGGRVENNYFHDIGYVGYWANCVSPWDNITSGGLKFLRNTTENTGRSGFDFGFNFHYGDQAGSPVKSQKFDFEIAYNDFQGWGSICQDVGGTYAWGQNDTPGLDYHHNWFRNSHAADASDVGLNVGIYFDQSTGPGRIHHNVVWAAGAGDFYHETHNSTRPFGAGTTWIRPYPLLDVYNNTFYNMSGFGLDNSPSFARSTITYEGSPFDKFRNNIYGSLVVADYGRDNANSVNPGTNPQFLYGNGQSSDIADINTHKGLYFQLASGSPARGIGVNNYVGVTGTITDAHTDAGAYPYGATGAALWVPGYSVVPTPSTGLVNDSDTGITYSTGWNYYSPFKSGFTNSDAHVTSALNATATYVFTETEINVTSEKCDNMGTMRVNIYDDTSVNGTFTDLIYGPVTIDLYNESLPTGSATTQNPCPNGQRMIVFTATGLAAGDKMIKMELVTQNNTAVPARNVMLIDDLIKQN